MRAVARKQSGGIQLVLWIDEQDPVRLERVVKEVERTAAHGGMACSHWWGHPRWPTQVERFMKALGDPDDDHWGPGSKYRAELPAEPVDVADRARLRHLLLSQPWSMSTDAAQWLVDAGIRYVSAEHGSFAV